MASLVARKKGNKLYYYYVVESARVDGQPRIVHQAYLGTAGKVADLVKDRTSRVPVSAASRAFGLPSALWLAAHQTGVQHHAACRIDRPDSRSSFLHQGANPVDHVTGAFAFGCDTRSGRACLAKVGIHAGQPTDAGGRIRHDGRKWLRCCVSFRQACMESPPGNC
jgi:hypothetical protein